MTEQNQTKRLAKNTLLLYFRMIIVMLAGLYTSRVVLKSLGVEDFGIYNVVGGVVAMCSMLTGSISAAIQRFFTFELGRNDKSRLKLVFGTSISIQLVFAVVIILLAEILGIWFINNKMNIPLERTSSALWVFHFSLITFAVGLVSVPYNAAIIAHEKMSLFAYISIFEVFAKLFVAYAISIATIDKLVFYSFLMSIVAVVVRLIYGCCCKKLFEECSKSICFDKTIFKEMLGFAGWNFIGASSSILRDQGGNILLNIFFGPVVNAARGISTQVNNAVMQFVTGFTTALNPQITKSYASGDYSYMMRILFLGSRISFYMLLILAMPIIINAKYLLTLWLGDFPKEATYFVQLIMIFSLSESISSPLITAMLATGKIRNYQLVVGGLQMLNFPISLILLKYGGNPETVFIVAIILSQACFFARTVMLKSLIKLPVFSYLKEVYLNVIFVLIISSILPVIVSYNKETSFEQFTISLVVSLTSVIATIYFVGCNHKERSLIKDKMLAMKRKFIG